MPTNLSRSEIRGDVGRHNPSTVWTSTGMVKLLDRLEKALDEEVGTYGQGLRNVEKRFENRILEGNIEKGGNGVMWKGGQILRCIRVNNGHHEYPATP